MKFGSRRVLPRTFGFYRYICIINGLHEPHVLREFPTDYCLELRKTQIPNYISKTLSKIGQRLGGGYPDGA